jgi:hypothetical protein
MAILSISLIIAALALAAILFLIRQTFLDRRLMDYSANLAINLHAQQMSATLRPTRTLPGVVRPDLIASLTTTRNRLGTVGFAIESMLLQSVRPASIQLYISDAVEASEIPDALYQLQDYGLHINFVPDVGPHTKLIYALRDFPGHFITTLDDDFYLPVNSMETLLRTSQAAPNAIVGNWVRQLKTDRAGRIEKAKCGKLITTKKQVREIDCASPALKIGYDYFAYGTSGVLYPPACLDDRVLDIDTFRRLCPTEDDIWFKAMSLLRDTPVAATSLGHSPKHHCLAGSQAVALRHRNYSAAAATEHQFSAVFEHFDLYERLKMLKKRPL